MDDDLDQVFPLAAFESVFLVLFEYLVDGDFDYNDNALLCNFATLGCSSIAKYSGATHAYGIEPVLGFPGAFTIWLDGSPYPGTAKLSSFQGSNPGGGDYMATWGKPLGPLTETPEPGAVLLLGAGLLGLAVLGRRKRRG